MYSFPSKIQRESLCSTSLVLNYEYYLGLTGGEKVTVILIIFFYVSVYILIILAEPFQRDADEPDENDEVSDRREEQDSEIEEPDMNDSVGEINGSEDKEVANDPCKFTYNVILILF